MKTQSGWEVGVQSSLGGKIDSVGDWGCRRGRPQGDASGSDLCN